MVIIHTPTGKDSQLTDTLLRDHHIATLICADIHDVGRSICDSTGVLLIAEEALADGGLEDLSTILAKQPVWSDLPVLLLARYGADSLTVSKALNALGNISLLERPVRPATLITAIRAALKARNRQHQVGEQVAELARANAKLEDSIRERELAEAALRHADRRKDEFLATLAHELRNPLAPIQNSLHILRLSNRDNPSSDSVCAMLERQVGHLVRLVDDLMEVSRITRGKIELQWEPVDVAAVIRNSIDESRTLINNQNHTLSVSLPDGSMVVNGDPLRLSQIFTNLLNNAAKYTDRGGHITVSAVRRDQSVQISVKDNGIGIPDDMLTQIFNMFTQVNRSSRLSQGGLGIGLTLVKTLTELHRGQIHAASPGLGHGSEFMVTLPLLPTTAFAPQPVSPRTTLLPSRRVLVVDDNRDAGESLSLLLELLGVETHVVCGGEAALRAIDDFRPTVVFLDLGMPGMDGFEVATRIRQKPRGTEILLVALTGWGQEEDRLRTSQIGFHYHFVKPVDIRSIESIFRNPR